MNYSGAVAVDMYSLVKHLAPRKVVPEVFLVVTEDLFVVVVENVLLFHADTVWSGRGVGCGQLSSM